MNPKVKTFLCVSYRQFHSSSQELDCVQKQRYREETLHTSKSLGWGYHPTLQCTLSSTMGERTDPGFREITKGTQEVVITSQEGFVLISMRKVEAQGRRKTHSALMKNRQFCAAMSLHSCIRSSDEMYHRKGQLTSVGSMRSNSEPTQGSNARIGRSDNALLFVNARLPRNSNQFRCSGITDSRRNFHKRAPSSEVESETHHGLLWPIMAGSKLHDTDRMLFPWSE